MQIQFGEMLFEVRGNKIGLISFGGYTRIQENNFVEVQICGENKDTHLGAKMVNSSEGKRLEYVSHTQTETSLEIVQRSALIEAKTTFNAYMGTSAVQVYTEIKNISTQEIVLEEVSAFVVSLLGDNCVDNSKNLHFYKFLQGHHAECQPRKQSFYDYGLHRGNIHSQRCLAFRILFV